MTSIWDHDIGDRFRDLRKSKRKKRKAKRQDKTALYFVIVFVAFILIMLPACGFSNRRSRNVSSGRLLSTEARHQTNQSAKPVENADQGKLIFSIVKKQNISYANTPRMVWRILLDIKGMPPEAQIKQTAKDIWESDGKRWKEFTVFVYLPEMNTEDIAFAIAEFANLGLKTFMIEPLSLIGTRWEKKSRIPIEKKIVASSKTIAKKKNIFINLEVLKTKPRELKITIKTNFPDGTLLHVTVTRDFNEEGGSETKVGDIWQEKIKVEGGNIARNVHVDDNGWQIFSSVTWASPSIEISVMMTPLSRTEDILGVIGKSAEYITGQGVEKTEFGFYWFQVTKRVNVPFEKAR